MTPLRICLDYLDSVGISYAHTIESTSCVADEMPDAQYASQTVVLKADDRYLLVVVPAEFHVETGNVGSVAGISKLRIATEAETCELFPFGEVGAVPPLGGLLGVPVYLDRKLADQEWIAFNAGTRGDLIRMKTADFQRIARTVVGPFGWPDYQKEFRSRLLASVKEAGR